jgi:hypothetical protein
MLRLAEVLAPVERCQPVGVYGDFLPPLLIAHKKGKVVTETGTSENKKKVQLLLSDPLCLQSAVQNESVLYHKTFRGRKPEQLA